MLLIHILSWHIYTLYSASSEDCLLLLAKNCLYIRGGKSMWRQEYRGNSLSLLSVMIIDILDYMWKSLEKPFYINFFSKRCSFLLIILLYCSLINSVISSKTISVISKQNSCFIHDKEYIQYKKVSQLLRKNVLANVRIMYIYKYI